MAKNGNGNGKTLDLPALENWLWEAACVIRGPLDAPKYKDYILPLVFLKRLSDVFDEEISHLAREFGNEETALKLVQQDHKLVRFFLPKKARWTTIAQKTTGLGEHLTDAVRSVARENPLLQGVIDVTDYNATTAGQRIVDDARLASLVQVLNNPNYSLAPNDLRVDRETLDKEFLELAELEGVSDIEELNQVLDRAVNLKNMLKNRERIDKVARFAAEHFQSTIEPMGYKAFFVAVDREACVLYKKALDKYLPPEQSTVVISSGGKGDPDLLREVQLSSSEEKEVRKAFRNSERLPKILIVTEKLLTGFDAPILYCMYLDKPMRDHVLLQAIARVNRPYEDEDGRAKPAGFVLDFVGIFENLEKALAFDSQDVKGVVEGIDVLKVRYAELMEQGRKEYLPITLGKKGDKAVEALLEHFLDKEKRQEFYQFFRELEEVYEILSPDPFLRPFLGNYTQLAEFYNLLRANYERHLPVDRDFLRKTAKLVQEHTDTGIIQTPDKIHRLDSDTLEQISASDKPATVKVFNLLKAIHDIVERDAHQEPYLISIGDKAEQIAQAFEARQQTSQQVLDGLERLRAELRQAQQRRVEMELSPEAFAVYWVLHTDGIAQAQDVAQAAAAAFEEHPHWQSSSHQEQAVRKSLYKALITAGIDGVVDVAQRLMKMLRRV